MKKFLFLLMLSFALYPKFSTADENAKNFPWEVLSDSIRKQYVPDNRVALFDVNYVVSGSLIIIKGVTTSPQAKSALLSGIQQMNYEVKDSLQLLPDSISLEGRTFGVVNLSVCNLRVAPDYSSEMATQALLGMPVKQLQRGEWCHIQTPDNYIAWVQSMGICPMTRAEYDAWNHADKIVVTSHYGFTYRKPDVSSQSVSDVVAGSRLKWEGTSGAFYKVSYPDGRKAYIAKSISMPEKKWKASVRQDAASILRTAYSLMGVPYLWGGISSKGVDCSGFVRTVFFMHNLIIPRDASQQAYVGQHIDIASDFSNLLPGDLIFFGRKATTEKKESVSHVAIYIGNKKFIHSSGYVHLASFDPKDPSFDEYNLNRMLFAVRILNRIGTTGINTTDTNPYYKE